MSRAAQLRDLYHRLRSTGLPPEAVMPLIDAAAEIEGYEREIGRLIKDAIPAERRLEGARALVVYFATDVDRDEFVDIFHQAKPNCQTVRVP
jgi:hypothetical protein